jgi:hypothetical protein
MEELGSSDIVETKEGSDKVDGDLVASGHMGS